MEKIELSAKSFSGINAEEKLKEEERDVEFEEMLSTLPREKLWNGEPLHLYQNFWCCTTPLKGFISFHQHFKARDTDLIVVSVPKSGTTWLKALAFAITKRAHYTIQESPLLTNAPHEVVRYFELDLYINNPYPDLEEGYYKNGLRIFATHAPYEALPSSIKNSGCRIVYVCRDPLDQLISYWHFASKFPSAKNTKPLLIEDVFELFCRGVQDYGPFWDHVLGFWKASLERPDKVLFFKYEDMKEDIVSHVKRLAQFSGLPFSLEEENRGVIEEISKLCCYETLKGLEVNKNGSHPTGILNSAFFRKAKVGDWTNYLTPSMAERLQKLMEVKLAGSGLTLKMSCQVEKDDRDIHVQQTST